MMDESFKDDTVVIGTTKEGDLEAGFTTGSYHNCQMDGCNGVRLSVKWPDGKHTFPCTKGMELRTDMVKGKKLYTWLIK